MKKQALIALCVLLSACLSACQPKSSADLYSAAVEDAKVCEAEEISPLLELSDGENLLVTWNSIPDTFPVGEEYTAAEGLELWCVSYDELKDWVRENSGGVTDWTARLEQLIGLPEGFGYTHFTAFSVQPADVIRPAYQPDAQKQLTAADLDGSALGEWRAWFEGNEQWSYADSAFPWTRLGYTYDWAEGHERGLCEFLIIPGAVVDTEWTMTTGELICGLTA